MAKDEAVDLQEEFIASLLGTEEFRTQGYQDGAKARQEDQAGAFMLAMREFGEKIEAMVGLRKALAASAFIDPRFFWFAPKREVVDVLKSDTKCSDRIADVLGGMSARNALRVLNGVPAGSGRSRSTAGRAATCWRTTG